MPPQSEPILEDDEEITRVRAARQRISERFGHDPYRLVAYYMELQKEHPERLVRAPEAEEEASLRAGEVKRPTGRLTER